MLMGRYFRMTMGRFCRIVKQERSKEMKRILLITMAMVFFVCGTVHAEQTAVKTYKLSLSVAETGTTSSLGTFVSGSTTARNGGASPFILSGEDMKRDDGISTIKDVRYLTSGNGVLWIESITISQHQQAKPVYYSGNTFYIASKSIPPDGNFDAAELVPISPLMSMDGITRYAIPFRLQVGSEHKFYFVTSGATAYDQAKAVAMIGLPESGWPDPLAFVIKSASLTMPGGATGVSTVAQIFGGTIPQGTKFIIVQAQSGGSIYYTSDGLTTPVSTGANPVGLNVGLGSSFETTAAAARNTWIDVGETTTTLHAQAWNRDPWK
jgi:hypothetical protein